MSDRRGFLAAIGAAVALAGCTGGDGTTTRTDSATPTPAFGEADGAWSQVGADAGNTYAVDVAGPQEEPTGVKLDRAGNAPITGGAPIVGDGRLYQFGPPESGEPTPTEVEYGGYEGPPQLIARDPATGERLWGVPANGSRLGGGIAVGGDSVIVAEDDPTFGEDVSSYRLRRLDADDGGEQWAVELSFSIGPPRIAGDSIVLAEGGAGDTPATVRSFGFDGAERWNQELVKEFADVVVNDGTAVAASYPVSVEEGAEPLSVVAGYSLDDGSEQWRVEYETEFLIELAAADGAVYVADEHEWIASLAVADGSERWRRDVDMSMRGTLAVTEGTVCLASGVLRGLDPEDGTERWTVGEPFEVLPNAEGVQYGPGSVSNVWAGAETVYAEVTGSPSAFVALDPASGEERWRRDLPTGTNDDGEEISGFFGDPLVADGAIYGSTPEGLYRYADSA